MRDFQKLDIFMRSKSKSLKCRLITIKFYENVDDFPRQILLKIQENKKTKIKSIAEQLRVC